MDTIDAIVHYTVIIGEVAIALGLVIFVHELGHFLVAKLCGVKCEKFYLGFDVYGLKLLKFQWGETEYGIGALPLGGYVKMLGQDDNPARAYEEMQRAKISAGEGSAEAAASQPASDAENPADGEAVETTVLDPRSYMAQSVPKRMAIISAGVVMNLIFAVIFGALAYGVGVQESPAVVSGTIAGQPAWRADLLPGDRILRVGDTPTPYFSDLMQAVMLGDVANGLDVTVDRPGVGEFELKMMTDSKLRKVPTIGVAGATNTTLQKTDRWADTKPVRKGSAAASAEPAFESNDEIVAIDGVAIASYGDMVREFARQPDQPLTVEVQRAAAGEAASQAASSEPERITITVPAANVRDLGLVMTAGPISAVQVGSPADGKLRVGDEILAIDGQPLGDPLRLPSRLNKRAGETVELRVRRADQQEPLDVSVELRAPRVVDWPGNFGAGLPLSVDALGIAFPVASRVAEVLPGGPGDALLIKPGDEIVEAAITKAAEPSKWRFRKPAPDTIVFRDSAGNDRPSWPLFMAVLQSIPDDATIELKVVREKEDDRVVRISPVTVDDWFNPDRGLNFSAEITTHRADSLGQALALGLDKTKDNVLLVYRFLRKLKEGQVPAAAIGGPITIAQQAGASAGAGFSHLLMFLVMLSANLAVINFLPIPLLDGGHMVFLTLEAIRRKPVSERVVVAFHYAGFLFLVSLMCFVFFLDLGGRTWLWKP